MTRSAFGLALGLLIVPSLAQAEQPGPATLTVNPTVSRAFKNVFNVVPRPSARVAQKFPSAPQKTDGPPDCRMLILPVAPDLDARILVGKVDERLDPRFVVRVPACEQSNIKPPPRD